MSDTVARKVIGAHLLDGRMEPGEAISIRIDQTLTQDATGTLVMQELEALHLDRIKTELRVKEAGKDAVDATKTTTKKAVNATERGTKKAWDATKRTTKKATTATKNAAVKTRDAVETAGHKTADGMRSTGKTIGEKVPGTAENEAAKK